MMISYFHSSSFTVLLSDNCSETLRKNTKICQQIVFSIYTLLPPQTAGQWRSRWQSTGRRWPCALPTPSWSQPRAERRRGCRRMGQCGGTWTQGDDWKYKFMSIECPSFVANTRGALLLLSQKNLKICTACMFILEFNCKKSLPGSPDPLIPETGLVCWGEVPIEPVNPRVHSLKIERVCRSVLRDDRVKKVWPHVQTSRLWGSKGGEPKSRRYGDLHDWGELNEQGVTLVDIFYLKQKNKTKQSKIKTKKMWLSICAKTLAYFYRDFCQINIF